VPSIASAQTTHQLDNPDRITRIISPGSSEESGTSTGAPSAWARALGFNEDRNGIAARTMPAPPVTAVATVKK
jgi:hypothetical protein